MIKIEITREGEKVRNRGEFDIDGTRRDAVVEFVSVMHALKHGDKEVFRDALQVLVKEDIHDMLDEMDELMDEGGKHDD